PTRYHRLVEPGTRFVYYRGRRRRGGGVRPQVYLGTGLVGAISPSSTAGRLVCQIDDFERFEPLVPFKVDGRYLERDAQPMGARAGLYFRQGVRRIDAATFRRICSLAEAD